MDQDVLLRLYQVMLRIRRFEEKVVALYPEQEMRTPVHLCIGQEAIAAGVCDHLRPDDFLFSTHRNHGHCLAKGMAPAELAAEFYGKITGCARGKGGSMHPVAPEIGIPGATAIVGGGIPIAVGAALACAMRNQDAVSVVFFGDGAAEEGSFHESLNFAALKKLPVVFVCENNLYATASPIAQRQSGPGIAEKAAGYGMPGERLDGNDVVAVHRVAGLAVQRARQGRGPTLIEALTYRWKGHVGPEDDTVKGVRPAEELRAWQERCPLRRHHACLERHGIVSQGLLEDLERRIASELDDAFQRARSAPPPAPEELLTNVFA
ncbi:MAG: thiamine pyrophosphate-dependent dehydrogenase E1 component subunit alpha [Thermodesulfobacteriota bacterium]